MKRALLAALFLTAFAASSSAEVFQDRFGNWIYTGPGWRTYQGPRPLFTPSNPDYYHEFHRIQREMLYDEYRRWRDCPATRRRC